MIHNSPEAIVDTQLIQPFPYKTLVNRNLVIETNRMMTDWQIHWLIRNTCQLWFKPKIWQHSRKCLFGT
jgi:hypothetical protein